MKNLELYHQRKLRRVNRTRTKLSDTASLPRLSVHRTLRHIQAQIIEPKTGNILAHSHDLKVNNGTKTDSATAVGKSIAEKALKANVDKVVFDRGSFKYHGRIAALADAARESGLKF